MFRISGFASGATLVALVVALLVAPVAAQDAATLPLEFPTEIALFSAEIPPRDRIELARELLGIDEIAPPPTSAPERQLGDISSFRVTNSSDDRVFEVTAELRAIGEHIYLWVEQGVPVNQETLDALARSFDTRIYPQTRALWGSEATPGIDGDPRIYGLFAHNMGSGTAAYFISDHTYPRAAVSTSNEHEMFFFNLDVLGYDFSLAYIESIVAHEFQHMIRSNLQVNEEYWVNEGFSMFTQLYLFDPPLGQALSFLAWPDTQLNAWAQEAGLRMMNYGASLLFFTYFHDRYGLEALRRLSADSSVRGLEGVDNVLRELGEPGVDEFFADWVLANFLFDSRLADGRYGYRSFPNLMISAAPTATVNTLPYSVDGIASQYGTDYYVFNGLDGVEALSIRLDAPFTTSLVPVSATSGQRMWYSNRADVSNTTLTRAFDLSGVDSATLSFNVWHDIEQYWDYGYVQVSGDGGATWDILETAHTITDNPHNTAYGPGYTGTSDGWLAETVSLDAYTGAEVLVRFQMITDDAVTQTGMAIDDVAIPEIGYSDDFEDDGGGWEAAGWLWIDNVLPQRVWVQAVQQIGDEVAISRWLASGAGAWELPLQEGVDQVMVAISPFAPVTTVPMPYTLEVAAR